MSSARYRIVRKIADGGMAELYLGMQRGAAGFERPIVIKRVRAGYCADPATRDALVDEAHVAMSLMHSNIVQVLDLGFAAGRYFLVLELVDGWDLSVLLERARQAGLPLPPELQLHLAAEVCRALAFAHAKTKDGVPLGVVHRDVNPHNVLVSEQGEVKLTDFGIATARTPRRASTLVGVIKGKLGFMSPEQAAGEPLDPRSDVFSLGCTLYQLATGAQPFAGGTELEMLLRMEQCAFRPLSEVAPEMPAVLAAILRRAMQRSRSDRYSSAEAMLADLERVQREAFRPAGQSELKAWLGELARRYLVPTISRRPASTHPADQGELPPGATLVLEEIDSDPGLAARARLPAPAAAAAPRAASPLPVRSTSSDAIPTRIIRRPGLPRPLISAALALALFLGAMGITVLVARPRGAATAAPAAQPAPAVLLDAGEARAAAEAEVAYPSLAVGREVPVSIDSEPSGASVTVNGTPMGTGPLRVRLRTGQAYEVRFEREGYRILTRRVLVSEDGAPDQVRATLQALPDPL